MTLLWACRVWIDTASQAFGLEMSGHLVLPPVASVNVTTESLLVVMFEFVLFGFGQLLDFFDFPLFSNLKALSVLTASWQVHSSWPTFRSACALRQKTKRAQTMFGCAHSQFFVMIRGFSHSLTYKLANDGAREHWAAASLFLLLVWAQP